MKSSHPESVTPHLERMAKLVPVEFPWVNTSVNSDSSGCTLVVSFRFESEYQSVDELCEYLDRLGSHPVTYRSACDADSGEVLIKAVADSDTDDSTEDIPLRVQPVVEVVHESKIDESLCGSSCDSSSGMLTLRDMCVSVDNGCLSVPESEYNRPIQDSVITTVTVNKIPTTDTLTPCDQVAPTVMIRHKQETETGRDFTTVSEYDFIRVCGEGVIVELRDRTEIIKGGTITSVNPIPPAELAEFPNQPSIGAVPRVVDSEPL